MMSELPKKEGWKGAISFNRLQDPIHIRVGGEKALLVGYRGKADQGIVQLEDGGNMTLVQIKKPVVQWLAGDHAGKMSLLDSPVEWYQGTANALELDTVKNS